MDKCFWCHKPEPIYAYNVCHACYRWFYRHSYLDDSDYCALCGKFITRRNKTVCKDCNAILKVTGHIPKRVENLEEKFKEVQPILEQFSTKDAALTTLSSVFKPKQLKFLEALLERFYNHVTLQQVADQWGTSREYIRQCENKAINIIKEKIID